MNIFKKKKPVDPLAFVGFLDSKPFHYFNEGLLYAKNRIVKKTSSYVIFTRNYNGVLFKFTLVNDFPNFNILETTIKCLEEENLLSEEEKDTSKSVNLYVIDDYSDDAKKFAKENTFLAKKGYQQILLYNKDEVRLDYFSPLPEFDFELMKFYRTAVFFDLACHDQEDY